MAKVAGRPDEFIATEVLAQTEHFQSAIRLNSGIALQLTLFPFRAQVQLGLARAYAMGGEKASAKKAYEAFFLTWKDADADLPMLVAAKKEYAALQN